MLKFLCLSACLLSMLCGVMPQAWAGPPSVVDLSIDGSASSEQVADEDIIKKDPEGADINDPVPLKQQMINYLRMNLPEKIEALQHEVAQLRGQMEMQAHDLKALRDQQKQYNEGLVRPGAQEKLASSNKALDFDSDKAEVTKSLIVHPKAKDKLSPALKKVSNVEKEQQAYNKAFTLIKEKKYSQAIDGLKAFLKAYPSKDDASKQYALNAYYWLGELYFLQGQLEEAKKQFEVIVNKFPGKAKAPDAMLKLGLISVSLGKKVEAKQTFQNIKKRFPDSSAAHTAALELKKL